MSIEESFRKLEDYIVREEYKGYDPYDALMSPVFKLPFFRTNKLVRLVTQQVVRRLPFNVRPLIGIRKSLNPVTAGLIIYAFSLLSSVFPERKDFYDKEIRRLVILLKECSSKGYSGICWGYDFDWEARYAKIPAYTPTIVATGIITNCLFESYRIISSNNQLSITNSQLKEGKEKIEEHISRERRESNEKEQRDDLELIEMMKCLLLSSVDFVSNDLKRSYEGESFCWSYSPFDTQKVYNATMKGARLLAQVYSVTKNKELIDTAGKTVDFVINNQNADGSWGYAKGDTRNWSDSYHTGYILDCLKSFIDLTGLEKYRESLDKGFEFFRTNFVGEDGFPKYYSNEKFPVDCTSAGQIVITLCNFGEYSLAEKVINYMISNMQSPKGYFYYQKGKYFTNKISYMRWSNAWMYLAMARLLYKDNMSSDYTD